MAQLYKTTFARYLWMLCRQKRNSQRHCFITTTQPQFLTNTSGYEPGLLAYLASLSFLEDLNSQSVRIWGSELTDSKHENLTSLARCHWRRSLPA